MIKNNIYLIIIFALASFTLCSCGNRRLINDSRFTTYFDKKERVQYEQLLTSFNAILLVKTGSDNLDSAYAKYFRQLGNYWSNEELVKSLEKEKKVVLHMIGESENHWKQIWTNVKGYDPLYGDFVSLEYDINSEGKYFSFLNSIKEDDKLFSDYYNRIESLGFISPAVVAGTVNWNRHLDMNNNLNRLIFAIHIYTISMYGVDG